MWCLYMWKVLEFTSRLDDECDMPEIISGNSTVSRNNLARVATSKDKQLLKKKLIKLQQDMLNKVTVSWK